MSDIVVEARRTAVLDFGPITRRSVATGLPVAIDLSLSGTKLWFTVKAAKSDTYAAAKVKKTYVVGGSADGFAIDDATSTDAPNGTITIPASELAYDERKSWYFDLTLEEPAGRKTTVDKGAFKILLPVTTA
jgi:hypothetical protein